MHGTFHVLIQKEQRDQVQKPAYKPVETEFRGAELPGVMLDHFFINTIEALFFCQIGNVAMQLAIQCDMLDHFAAVYFQSAVEIMKPDACCE